MGNPDRLTEEQGQALVRLARSAIERQLRSGRGRAPAGSSGEQERTAPVDPRLREKGATFVTLTIGGALRGCIGSPEAHEALVDDVQANAISAATMDPRFPVVAEDELDHIEIEVSVLTPPRPLDCPPEERPQRVEGLGLLLTSGYRYRSLLLPQVWDKIAEPEEFLGILCQKAGLPAQAWQRPDVKLHTFEVQAFHET